MLMISSAIMTAFLCMNQILHSSEGSALATQAAIRIQLDGIYAEIDRLIQDKEATVILPESEFTKSCRCLGLDESKITPAEFQQAYVRAIANKDIHPSLLKLPWDVYVDQVKNNNPYREIDIAHHYLIDFFKQQTKLIKMIKAAQMQKEHEGEISEKNDFEFLEILEETSPEALAQIHDDAFKFISSEYGDFLNVQQLCMLSKSQVKILTDRLAGVPLTELRSYLAL